MNSTVKRKIDQETSISCLKMLRFEKYEKLCDNLKRLRAKQRLISFQNETLFIERSRDIVFEQGQVAL